MKGAACLLVASVLLGCGGSAAGGRKAPPSPAGPPLSPPATGVQGSFTRQLIVRFRPGTVACDPAGIARLSSATRVSLTFVRAMSGDACVVKQLAGSEEELLRGQERLRQDPAVEHVEPDAAMKAP